MRRLALLAIASAALSVALAAVYDRQADAVIVTPTGAIVEVSYVEPSQYVDDTPLEDLAETRVYATRDGQAPAVCATVPASTPAGGGSIVTTCSVAQGRYTFHVTAVTASGFESDPSESVRKVLLKPKPPV